MPKKQTETNFYRKPGRYEPVDVLFFNPPSPDGDLYIRDHNRSGRKSREGYIWPQTSLAYLAAMIKDKLKVDIIDCIAENIDWNEAKKIILTKKPKYFVTHVISSTLYNDMYGTLIAKAIGSKTITMGCHVTELTKETLDNFSTLDFIMRLEPEITFKELIEALENGENLSSVKGIAYRQNGKVVINPDREYLKNLDDLPLPLQELLPLEKYAMPFVGRKFTFVLASRGCPFHCIFCRQPIMWQRKVRLRAPEVIINELKRIEKLGVKSINFQSDDFTVNRDWVIKLCKLIVQENIKIRWLCNSRCDTVDPEMLSWVKRAGCWLIGYGIESGSQKILDNCKKNLTLKQIKEAVKWTKDEGIDIWGWFVIGLPGETPKTIRETIDLAKNLPLDVANFAFAAPYPGTEFYEYVDRKGYLVSHNWEDYDQNYSAVVSYPKLSASQIEKAIKKATLEWTLRPGPIFWLLKGAKDWYTLKFLTKIALNHLSWFRHDVRAKNQS